MVTGAERLLRIEDDLDLTIADINRLPTRPNHDTCADPEGLHRFSPLPIPILIRKSLHLNFWHRYHRLEALQSLSNPDQTVQRPTVIWPIQMYRRFKIGRASCRERGMVRV